MPTDKILITVSRKLFVTLLAYAKAHDIPFPNKSGGVVHTLEYITRDISVTTETNFVNEMLAFGFIPPEVKGGSVEISIANKTGKPKVDTARHGSTVSDLVTNHLNKEK